MLPRLTGRRDRSPHADMKSAASVLPASLSMLTRKLKSATGFAFFPFFFNREGHEAPTVAAAQTSRGARALMSRGALATQFPCASLIDDSTLDDPTRYVAANNHPHSNWPGIVGFAGGRQRSDRHRR